jgi:hypothetical protein
VKRNPAMQFTMGFTIQGPSKEREANHDLLMQFCERREEAALATTKDALCQFYDSIRQIARTNLGMCNQEAVASTDYSRPGSAEHCFTYDDLHERCGEFMQDYDKMAATYEDYRQGRREDYEFNANGGLSDLRKFYNQIQLWRHCADRFKHERGYDFPYAPDIIRLIKYKKLTENIAKMNAAELAQFDVMLDQMGLASFKLGDISKIPRAELVTKIERLVTALQAISEGGQNSVTLQNVGTTARTQAPAPASTAQVNNTNIEGAGFLFDEADFTESAAPAPAPQPVVEVNVGSTTITKRNGLVNGVNPATASRMAQCLAMTLIQTDYRCTRFSMVGDHPKTRSQCIMSYENAGKPRQNSDPC